MSIATMNTTRPNRTMLGVAAGLALAAMIVIAAVLAFGSAPTQQAMNDAVPVVDDAEDDADVVEETLADEVTVDIPLATVPIALDRDPFEPVVPEPEPEEEAADPLDPTVPGTDPSQPGTDPLQPGTGTPGTGTPGTGTPGTGTPGTGAPGTGTDPSRPGQTRCVSGIEVVCEGAVLTVSEVRTGADGELEAVLQIDTLTFIVRAGDVISVNPSFRVLSVQSTGVTLQNGDAIFEVQLAERQLK